MIFRDQYCILNTLTSTYLVTYTHQMKCTQKHVHMHAHMRTCMRKCALVLMHMHTMSTFDTIYLLAWIGTAQIVPICFDTTHVLFDSGICQYSSQLNAVLAPLVSESKLEYFLKSQIQISTFENLNFEKLDLHNSTSNST